MASTTVAVRLPKEMVDQLQGVAAAQGKKVSDVVKDLIARGLKSGGKATSAEDNALVIEYLQGFGDVLVGLMHETTGARYFAEMATSYAADMESLLRDRQVMDQDSKAALMRQFKAAALEAAQEAWDEVLGLKREQAEST